MQGWAEVDDVTEWRGSYSGEELRVILCYFGLYSLLNEHRDSN